MGSKREIGNFYPLSTIDSIISELNAATGWDETFISMLGFHFPNLDLWQEFLNVSPMT
jgi:hypothetical protein